MGKYKETLCSLKSRSCSVRQVRKRTLQTVRLDGSSDSLKLRLELSQKLGVADRLWRDRLVWFLNEGNVI